MGLGVVARYSTLVEAEVACSALRGAGLHAEVMERGMATTFWTRQTALGGVRLVVPSSELADATDYLAAILSTRSRYVPRPHEMGVIWRLLALLAGLAIMPEAGWLVIGARDRAAKGSALSIWGAAMVAAALATLVGLAVYLIPDLIGQLMHPRITGS